MTDNTATFANVTYTPAAVDQTMPKGTVSLLNRTGPELATLHNLVASNLGRQSTARFKDNKAAVKRTWAMLEAYRDTVAKEQAADTFSASEDELAQQKIRQAVRRDGDPSAQVVNDSGTQLVNTGKDTFKLELSEADRKQVSDEAASRKSTPEFVAGQPATKSVAKRGSQAGTIRKPREPKADDGTIRMPTEGGKQRAKRQKDGSYAFRIPAGKPRTATISAEREELLGLLVSGEARWADIVAQLNKADDANNFKAVTTVTMFCITLGYGVETDPATGLIKLIEPLS